jgi:hypothetical protein
MSRSRGSLARLARNAGRDYERAAPSGRFWRPRGSSPGAPRDDKDWQVSIQSCVCVDVWF